MDVIPYKLFILTGRMLNYKITYTILVSLYGRTSTLFLFLE